MNYINYNEADLNQFFQSNPIYLAEREAGICLYSKVDALHLKLVLTLFSYEKKCFITISHEQKNYIFFNKEYKSIDSIDIIENNLVIKRDDNHIIKIAVKPHIHINFSLK